MALRLGGLVVGPPLVLAPMAGVTDRQFRLVLRRVGGVGLVTMEFISSEALTRGNPRTRHLMRYLMCHEPIVFGPAMFEFDVEYESLKNYRYKVLRVDLGYQETLMKEVAYAHTMCMQLAASPVIRAAAEALRRSLPDVGVLNTQIVMGALVWRWFYLHEIVPLFTAGISKARHVLQVQTLSDAASVTTNPITYEKIINIYSHLATFAQITDRDADDNANVVSPKWAWIEDTSSRLPRIPLSICANFVAKVGRAPEIVDKPGRARKRVNMEAVARRPVLHKWLLRRQLKAFAMIEMWKRVGSARPTISGEYNRKFTFLSHLPETGQWHLDHQQFVLHVPQYRTTQQLLAPNVIDWRHHIRQPISPNGPPQFVPIDYRRRIWQPASWVANARTAQYIFNELIAHCRPVDRPEAHTCISIAQFLALYVYWTRHCQLAEPPIVLNVGGAKQLHGLIAQILMARAGRLPPPTLGVDDAEDSAVAPHGPIVSAKIWAPLSGSIFCTLVRLAGRDFNPVTFLRELGAGNGHHDEFTNFLWDNQCRKTARTGSY